MQTTQQQLRRNILTQLQHQNDRNTIILCELLVGLDCAEICDGYLLALCYYRHGDYLLAMTTLRRYNLLFDLPTVLALLPNINETVPLLQTPGSLHAVHGLPIWQLLSMHDILLCILLHLKCLYELRRFVEIFNIIGVGQITQQPRLVGESSQQSTTTTTSKSAPCGEIPHLDSALFSTPNITTITSSTARETLLYSFTNDRKAHSFTTYLHKQYTTHSMITEVESIWLMVWQLYYVNIPDDKIITQRTFLSPLYQSLPGTIMEDGMVKPSTGSILILHHDSWRGTISEFSYYRAKIATLLCYNTSIITYYLSKALFYQPTHVEIFKTLIDGHYIASLYLELYVLYIAQYYHTSQQLLQIQNKGNGNNNNNNSNKNTQSLSFTDRLLFDNGFVNNNNNNKQNTSNNNKKNTDVTGKSFKHGFADTLLNNNTSTKPPSHTKFTQFDNNIDLNNNNNNDNENANIELTFGSTLLKAGGLLEVHLTHANQQPPQEQQGDGYNPEFLPFPEKYRRVLPSIGEEENNNNNNNVQIPPQKDQMPFSLLVGLVEALIDALPHPNKIKMKPTVDQENPHVSPVHPNNRVDYNWLVLLYFTMIQSTSHIDLDSVMDNLRQVKDTTPATTSQPPPPQQQNKQQYQHQKQHTFNNPIAVTPSFVTPVITNNNNTTSLVQTNNNNHNNNTNKTQIQEITPVTSTTTTTTTTTYSLPQQHNPLHHKPPSLSSTTTTTREKPSAILQSNDTPTTLKLPYHNSPQRNGGGILYLMSQLDNDPQTAGWGNSALLLTTLVESLYKQKRFEDSFKLAKYIIYELDEFQFYNRTPNCVFSAAIKTFYFGVGEIFGLLCLELNKKVDLHLFCNTLSQYIPNSATLYYCLAIYYILCRQLSSAEQLLTKSPILGFHNGVYTTFISNQYKIQKLLILYYTMNNHYDIALDVAFRLINSHPMSSVDYIFIIKQQLLYFNKTANRKLKKNYNIDITNQYDDGDGNNNGSYNHNLYDDPAMIDYQIGYNNNNNNNYYNNDNQVGIFHEEDGTGNNNNSSGINGPNQDDRIMGDGNINESDSNNNNNLNNDNGLTLTKPTMHHHSTIMQYPRKAYYMLVQLLVANACPCFNTNAATQQNPYRIELCYCGHEVFKSYEPEYTSILSLYSNIYGYNNNNSNSTSNNSNNTKDKQQTTSSSQTATTTTSMRSLFCIDVNVFYLLGLLCYQAEQFYGALHYFYKVYLILRLGCTTTSSRHQAAFTTSISTSSAITHINNNTTTNNNNNNNNKLLSSSSFSQQQHQQQQSSHAATLTTTIALHKHPIINLPQYPLVLFNIAQSFRKIKQYQMAIPWYLSLLYTSTTQKLLYEVYIGIGMCYHLIGALEKSRDAYVSALTIFPDSPLANQLYKALAYSLVSSSVTAATSSSTTTGINKKNKFEG